MSFFHTIDKRRRQKSSSENIDPGIDQTDKCVKKKPRKNTLDMERFLTDGDQVWNSSKYRKILCSSSDEDSNDDRFRFQKASDKQKLRLLDNNYSHTDTITMIDSDASGEDQVYEIDAFTGEWKGYRQQPSISGGNLIDISNQKREGSSSWRFMGRKVMRTSLNISHKIQDRNNRASGKRYRDEEDGSTVKLLNEDDTDESDAEGGLDFRLVDVDSSTDTSTNLALI